MIQLQVYLAFASVAIVLGIISCASIDGKVPDTVQMIAAIFRHGDRSPIYSYPKDPYDKYEWPGGRGALSQKGALQHFNLGKKLRVRYHQLLPKDGQYTKDEMYVVSSYIERCLMSVQSLLAGFMPPLESKNLLPVNWQPIPISTSPGDVDYMLAQHKTCKKYDTMFDNLRKDLPLDLKILNEENKDLYRLLTKHTGKNISQSSDIRFLYDTLLVQKNAGLQLPAWTENVFPKRMHPFAERDNTLQTETLFMKKVKGGPFITEVFRNMIKKRANILEPNRKIFLYSAHDITLVHIMNSLDIINQTTRLPDYASMLILELHENPALDEDLEVKVFYYPNSEAHFPKEVHIPQCSRPCSLTQFGEINNKLLINNWDELCGNVPYEGTS